MRSVGFALLAMILIGACRKSASTADVAAPSSGVTVQGPPPREVPPDPPQPKKKDGGPDSDR